MRKQGRDFSSDPLSARQRSKALLLAHCKRQRIAGRPARSTILSVSFETAPVAIDLRPKIREWHPVCHQKRGSGVDEKIDPQAAPHDSLNHLERPLRGSTRDILLQSAEALVQIDPDASATERSCHSSQQILLFEPSGTLVVPAHLLGSLGREVWKKKSHPHPGEQFLPQAHPVAWGSIPAVVAKRDPASGSETGGRPDLSPDQSGLRQRRSAPVRVGPQPELADPIRGQFASPPPPQRSEGGGASMAKIADLSLERWTTFVAEAASERSTASPLRDPTRDPPGHPGRLTIEEGSSDDRSADQFDFVWRKHVNVRYSFTDTLFFEGSKQSTERVQ
jgi:hypothetical protein